MVWTSTEDGFRKNLQEDAGDEKIEKKRRTRRPRKTWIDQIAWLGRRCRKTLEEMKILGSDRKE